jgi:hypothetical protein
MNISLLRAISIFVSLGALSALGILVLFFPELTSIQVGLLTMVLGAVISEVKSASAWLFDGVPEKK